VGRGREHDVGAAELLQTLAGRHLFGVHVLVRPELAGQLLLVGPARERDRSESHFGCELQAQVAQTANALNRHRVSGARAAIAECIVRRNARAEQRSRVHRLQRFGQPGQRLGRHHGVFRVATVMADAGDFRLDAIDEQALATIVAHEAVPAVPAHTDALTRRVIADPGTDRIHAPRDLVARNSRQREARIQRVLHHRVAVTDATRLYLDAHLPRARLGNITFHQLECAASLRNLNRSHFRHGA
jgi:hypothetical protein